MKMTKKLFNELECIRTHLERGIKFLNSPDYAFARRGKHATTTQHYARPDGATLYEVDREIGSDLCQLYDALRRLDALLDSSKL